MHYLYLLLLFLIIFRQLVYLKLKNDQLSSVPFFILCDGLKNNTVLLGGDLCKGWHSRYWAEYKGHNDIQHDELSVQCMIKTHNTFPQVSNMVVNKLLLFNSYNCIIYVLLKNQTILYLDEF